MAPTGIDMTTMNVMTCVCGTATCYGATDTITDTTNTTAGIRPHADGRLSRRRRDYLTMMDMMTRARRATTVVSRVRGTTT